VRYSPTGKNVMLEALDEGAAAGAKYGSLHSAYSVTGANELTGGSPAYARKALTWAGASAGAKALSSAVVFDAPAGSTVQFFGLWDALTSGNFLGMTPNNGGVPQAFVVPDISADILEGAAHGYANNDTVIVWSVSGDPLPGGLTEATLYYVVSATTDDLKLSATLAGAAINITSIGAGTLQKLTSETYAGQGTHTISAASLGID
jgi:hypothetical protein